MVSYEVVFEEKCQAYVKCLKKCVLMLVSVVEVCDVVYLDVWCFKIECIGNMNYFFEVCK